MLTKMASDLYTHISATKAYKAGEIVVTEDRTWGTRFWRYVKNTETTLGFPLGTNIQRAAATVDNMSGVVCVTAKVPRGKLLGVSQCPSTSTWAAGSFSFALFQGLGYGLGDGSVTAGSAIISDATSGRFKPATLTNPDEVAAVVGTALEDDGAAGSTFRAHFYYP